MSGLFIRIFNLLFFPTKEWKTIAEEDNSRKTIYKKFVVPLLCFMTIATIVGTWLYTTRELYTLGYVIYKIAILWSSLSVALYVSAFLVTEIMAQQLGQRNHKRDFALMAYSASVAYLVIIVWAMFPFFSEFLVLILYSCYLYWIGIPFIIQREGREQTFYGLLSFSIMMITYILTFFLFGKILKAMLI